MEIRTLMTYPSIVKSVQGIQLPRGILVARCILFSIVIGIFCNLTDPKTPALVLQAAAVCGILSGALGARSALTALASILSVGLAAIILSIIALIFPSLDSLFGSGSLFFYRFSEHFELASLFFLLFTAATWAYLRSRVWIFVESLLLLLGAVQLMAGHRNLRFDSPRWIADFSWSLGVSPLSGLIVLGMFVLVGVLSYLSLGSIVHTETPKHKKATSSKRSFLLHIATLGGIFILCLIVGREVFNYYESLTGDRLANGVGQESEAGKSPLSFYSSLGGSNEPSALLRLESDYIENPLAPMLYLRENALSDMGVLGLTVGPWDDDIPRTAPSQNYAREKIESYVERKEVRHSVYLMSEHETAFAIGYPTSIVPLKNPDEKRFLGAFRATSLAPAFPLSRLDYATAGNPDWDPEILKYYTIPHPNDRYAAEARKITKGAQTDIEKAFYITEYFNKNAIYTLSPDHDVPESEDPVAPFLFGDMRGYCVHFAHATVYMLRSLGIPSRIATGYLTDLSQSKDGHILLRMSDRHAWAEVYVTERGWIPFDTTPEQVESHANTEMNVELLEELMGLLDPGEEILPEDILEDEENIEEPATIYTPDPGIVLVGLALLALSVILLKIYLLFGWMLVQDPKRRLKLCYRAILVRLYDLGLPRNEAETRREFTQRLLKSESYSQIGLTEALLESTYGNRLNLSTGNIDSLYRQDLEFFHRLQIQHKIYCYFNPSSVLAFLGGKGW